VYNFIKIRIDKKQHLKNTSHLLILLSHLISQVYLSSQPQIRILPEAHERSH